ncbi:VOC family protein [Phenylobacterium deserti]|uniref:VOC family protein n=1 Tax=Phenylobacterium deserti TaxID=1914756 RepID=A0A328AU50_9CAUL|nr:VOC family protein [Phenylobacterium deserti]RAK56468.1 VOC family protein [Phenylobacterium deserti]
MGEALETERPAAAAVEVKGGVAPYLMVDGAIKAAEFYGRAFGATTADIYPPDEQGRTMHVHLYVNGSSIMMSDPYPEHGCPWEAPQGFSLCVMSGDCDADFKRAVDAGCQAMMEPADMFYGDRYAQVRDPFGYVWGFNQVRR